MNGRHSFDRNRLQKPMNINIYYNINSRNITNNHEVMSHPVSARIPRASLEDQPTHKPENKSKIKTANKLRKKKYSMDLGNMLPKKPDRVLKKSNNNSMCSGIPPSRRGTPKLGGEKKQVKDGSEKKQKKLAVLLQNFSGGQIDKQKLKKQILSIFEEVPKAKEQERKHKKRQSQSTLLCTSTPRNNVLLRLSSATANNLKQMQNTKTRKKQSKSERCSYSNSKTILSKDKIVQKFVQVKGIDSSLFLGQKQEEKTGFIEMTNEVYTSSSVMLLKQHIERERKLLIVPKLTPYLTLEERMAIKIQRAWRRHKTNKLIKTIFAPKKIEDHLDDTSLIENVVYVTTQNGLDVENFLSQQLGNKKTIGEFERVKGQTLRKHELDKWNQIMGYVQMNMKDKQLTSEQCLTRIIEYFENVKESVQNQLLVDKLKEKRENLKQKQGVKAEVALREEKGCFRKMKKSVSKDQRQMTEFTNNALSKQVRRENEGASLDRSDFKKINDEEWGEKQEFAQEQEGRDEDLQSFGVQQSEDSLLQINEMDSQVSSQSPFSKNIVLNKKMNAEHHFQLNKILNSSHYINFDTMNQALLNYSKKLENQHEQELQELNIQSTNYLENKKKIDKKYNESKKQLKRIIRNLNKGYEDAKNILEKQIVMVSEEGTIYNSKSSLSKCKSDNYLLKTAINYKKFIEKKEEKSKKKKEQPKITTFRSCSDESVHDSNFQIDLEIDKFSDLNPGTSLELAHCLNLIDKEPEEIFPRKIDQGEGQNEDFSETRGMIHDTTCINFKLDENAVMSAELLQYEEMGKKFQDDDSQNLLQEENAEYISLFDNNKLNEVNKKIKNLTNEDKQDIFEFIFIDITLELITEYEGTQIYDKICKYLNRIKKLENIPKGVKTGIPACKDYLSLLQGFINEGYSQIFCKHIGVPMGPTASEMLKYMHDEDPSEDGEQQNKGDEQSVSLILPVPIFELLQKKIVPNYPRYYEDQSKENSRVKFLKSVDHIHHKALFDSLNQWLDNERPFGIWGKPFPWRTSFKRKDTHATWTVSHKMGKLSRGMERVVECCSYLCGILVDKQQSLFGNHKVSQHYVQQIRENRMSKMLENDLHQNEDRWQFYDDEQTEVLIEMTKYVSQILLLEATVQMYSISHEMNSEKTRELVETFNFME